MAQAGVASVQATAEPKAYDDNSLIAEVARVALGGLDPTRENLLAWLESRTHHADRLRQDYPAYRMEWCGRVQNWLLKEEGESDAVPVAHQCRSVVLARHIEYDGLSLLFDEPWGAAEVHVELNSDGMHLRVYLPDFVSGEPAINASLFPDGVRIIDGNFHISNRR